MRKISITYLVAISSALILLLSSCCTGSNATSSPKKAFVGEGGLNINPNKGLQYLVRMQNEDGSWGKNPEHQAGLTSMCIEAFNDYGETPSSREYGETVIKGLKRLIGFAEEHTKAKSPSTLWEACENGMLFWALTDSYALTRIPTLEKSATGLLKKLVADQTYLGIYKDKNENDIMVAAFSFIGLKFYFKYLSAESQNGKIKKLLTESIDSISKNYALPDGSFVRKKGEDGSDFTATCLATFCMLRAGRLKETEKGLKWIESFKFSNCKTLSLDWENPPDEEWDPLSWCVITDMIFERERGGGPTWGAWNQECHRTLMKIQADDGSLTVPSINGKSFFKGSISVSIMAMRLS